MSGSPFMALSSHGLSVVENLSTSWARLRGARRRDTGKRKDGRGKRREEEGKGEGTKREAKD